MIASRYSYQAEFRRMVSHFTVAGAAVPVILAIAATSSGQRFNSGWFPGCCGLLRWTKLFATDSRY
jgi:hypothetical protein